jgi:hypothetical protein
LLYLELGYSQFRVLVVISRPTGGDQAILRPPDPAL